MAVVLRGFAVFTTDTNKHEQITKASLFQSGLTQPYLVVVFNVT